MSEATRRLPGLLPLEGEAPWLVRDEAFAGQMALRDRLVADRRDDVIAQVPGSEAAVSELYGDVLEGLRGRAADVVRDGAYLRSDGIRVPLDETDRLGTLARLVQQDLCVLEKSAGTQEHVMTAAIVCFPASWTLSEKIGHPLSGIHGPVEDYDGMMERRVQRVFDHLRDGRPVWRQNALIYDDPELFQPRRMDARRPKPSGAGYLRSEKQVLLRLPKTGAVVFSIHTYVVAIQALSDAQREGLADVHRVT